MVHKAAPNDVSPKRLKQLFLYRGVPARVADQLGVSRSFVYRVVKGKKKSKRVLAALNAEMRRTDVRNRSGRAA